MKYRPWLPSTILMASLVLLYIVACSDSPSAPPPTPVPSAIGLSSTTANFTHLGQTVQVTASVRDQNGAPMNAAVSWSVEQSNVATVSGSGVIAAAGNGTTTVRATAGSASASVTVSVAQQPAALTVSANTVTLTAIGAVHALSATVNDAGGHAVAGAQVTWTSSDQAVVTVSNAGTVTAVGPGATTITAQAGSASASVAVSVAQQPATLTVSTDTVTLTAIGAVHALSATVTDAGGHAVAGQVTWTSSDQAVVTVTNAGAITAVGPGTATITAQAGTLTATVNVSVEVVVAQVARIEIVAPAAEVNEDGTLQLTANLFDQAGGATTGTVTWISDSTAYAAVDGNGLVHGVRAGSTRIRARVGAVEDTLDLPVRGLWYRWTFSETGGAGTIFRDDISNAEARLVDVGNLDGHAAGGRVSLTGGARSAADYVALPAGLLRNRSKATVEVWATLHGLRAWSRVFDVGADPANNLFISWSMGTAAGTDRTEFTINGVPHRRDNTLAPFTIDYLHHIVLTIEEGAGTGGATRLGIYLDGTPRGSFDTSHKLSDLADNNFWLGRSHYAGDETAYASYEEVRIHDRAFDANGVQQIYLRGPVRSGTPVSVAIQTPRGMENMIRGVNVRFPLRAVGSDGQGQSYPLFGVRWTSSNPAVATIDSLTGAVHTVAEGNVTFTATAAGATASTWTRNVVRIRRMQVDPYLATPIAGALWEVPVVLIEYHPTADGYGLDTLKVPDFYWSNPLSLDSLERMTLRFAQRRKMMVEQGSRFRGYRDAAALPSLGYRVIEHIIVYDQIPPHPTKRSHIAGNPRFEDWHASFADLQLVPLLRAQRVREVWAAWAAFDGGFPSYNAAHHKDDDMRVGWESNMSSPTTGDISNSDRDPVDAPVLEHTYIIYGINFRRSQAEAVHNVGHQLESMMSYINYRQDANQFLFWRSFVGQDASNQFITGRAGWTHMPPNTTQNYDYLNSALVAADIEDWRPDNSGAKTQVNVNTWGNLTYPWPGEAEFGQRIESQWYTYWFQNFPGRGNQIPHGSYWMTNWWAFVADWDATVTSGLGLYGSSPAAQKGTAPYPSVAPAVRPEPVRHTIR